MAAANGRLAGGISSPPALSADAGQRRVPDSLPKSAGISHDQLAWGTFGALQMGLLHGVVLPGLLLAVDVLLFVVGVITLCWVVALTAFVLIEKIGPFGLIVARVAGAI